VRQLKRHDYNKCDTLVVHQLVVYCQVDLCWPHVLLCHHLTSEELSCELVTITVCHHVGVGEGGIVTCSTLTSPHL